MTDKPAVDWRYWRHMLEVKQWEACALSLNIDPNRMQTRTHAWMAGPGSGPAFLRSSFPSESSKTEFEKRLRLLGACLFKSEHFTIVNNLVRGGKHLATVSLSEFAAWGQSVEFEMPPELAAMAVPATDTAKPAPEVALGASGGVELDKTVPAKPLQRTAAQDSAILSEIEKLGYDPMALPKNPPGKPGAKAAIRIALAKSSLFTGARVFDKAWERLTSSGDIVIQG